MLCPNRNIPPVPTITKSDMSKSNKSTSSNGQRRDFWNIVLHDTDQPSSPPQQSSDSNSHSRQRHSEDAASSSSSRKETPCPICGALFKRKYDLHQHISAVHEKNRPFKCDACEATFAHKGTLSKHIRTVHKRERPHQCQHCGAKFSEKGNVNKHKQRSAPCKAAEEKAARAKPSSSKHS